MQRFNKTNWSIARHEAFLLVVVVVDILVVVLLVVDDNYIFSGRKIFNDTP